ncbi:MAG: cupin-like domain-containing protein [Cellvibrio sp.]|uniref:cupin-like domain-containing protein n=1 Tax=Cellvibrio sp. TaxID=1965322 RepID=UPI002716154F|nr:cupin-like domain-containing protein [Cellvibrio sp.]
MKKTKTLYGINSHNIPRDVINSAEPVVLKQLVGDWPLVQAGRTSDRASVDYLKSFYNGAPTIVCKIPAENNGRMFYSADCTKLDYESFKGRIDETLDGILEGIQKKNDPAYYIASNIIDTHLPGLRGGNEILIPRDMHGDAIEERVSIWIGGATTATCHFDALDNIACCVAGKRRFTIFPPDQISNLYPGPLEPTPGGQVISLVDFKNPDFQKFPRFKDALLTGQVADLEPGDALYLPSMWWHHVESLEPYNVLVNYWWEDGPAFLTSGMNALYMAMLGIRDKPVHEREGWRHVFNHYIFDGPEKSNSFIPSEARGFLHTLDRLGARKLRALLINKLNR